MHAYIYEYMHAYISMHILRPTGYLEWNAPTADSPNSIRMRHFRLISGSPPPSPAID